MYTNVEKYHINKIVFSSPTTNVNFNGGFLAYDNLYECDVNTTSHEIYIYICT